MIPSDSFRYIQIRSDMFRYVQKCSDRFIYVYIHSDMSDIKLSPKVGYIFETEIKLISKIQTAANQMYWFY